MPASRNRLAAGGLAAVLIGSTIGVGALAAGAASNPTYTVRGGDTLSQIAARFGVTTNQLAFANGVGNANHIFIGSRLVIPTSESSGSSSGSASRVHVVRPGESFWSIAHEHGTTVRALAAANGRSTSSMLLIGDRLVVPATADTGGGVPARLIRSGRISLRPTFTYWANRNGISPALLQAVCYLESGWQSHVVSSTGAVGVCQLMPDTVSFARDLIGVSGLDPRDPEDNIRMGARFLRLLLSETGGNTGQALAGYYQGLASVRRSGPYPETLQYVSSVQALVGRF